MGYTVFIDCETFEKEVLPPETRRHLHDPDPDVAEKFEKRLACLFSGEQTPYENVIVTTFVKAVNDLKLSPKHVAKASMYKPAKGDVTNSKVDAAIYPEGSAPTGGCPDWTHCRLFVEFKRGGTSNDPFDDDELHGPESGSNHRSEVHSQLLACAHNTFLYQHRAWLYSILINGQEFRLMRWDRSGLIVTKKLNYLEDPKYLLRFLAYFGALAPDGQGMDPTATLIKKHWNAYKLMDEMAQENESDLEHAEGTTVPKYPSPPSQPSSGPTPSSSSSSAPPSERLTAGKAATSTTYTSQRVERPTRVTRSITREAAAFAAMPPPPPPTSSSHNPGTGDESGDIDVDIIEGLPDSEDPRVFRYVRQKFRESLQDDSWPRYKLLVGADNRVFLVGKPVFFSISIFGRATRGYIALDVKNRSFMFLKDSWRPFYVGVEPEGQYLDALMAVKDTDEEVREDIRIPRPWRHGDVESQRSFTAAYAEWRSRRQTTRQNSTAVDQSPASASDQRSSDVPDTTTATTTSTNTSRSLLGKRSREELNEEDQDTSRGKPRSQDSSAAGSENAVYRLYTHYRIVVRDVCLPFSEFTSSKQLVLLILHCMTTHWHAYRCLRLLHRDVSAGNILIHPRLQPVDSDSAEEGSLRVEWSGILTDWELAKYVPEETSKESPRQPERTGTWQFMSAAYVQEHPRRPVVVSDELESFFHVMLFYAVRYVSSNVANVGDFIRSYFDTFGEGLGGGRLCGAEKSKTMATGALHAGTDPLKFYDKDGQENVHFNLLLKHLLLDFKLRYDYIAWKRRTSSPSVTARGAPAVARASIKLPSTLSKPTKTRDRLPVQPEAQGTKLEEAANSLENHRFITDDLVAALMEIDPEVQDLPPWPEADVVPDRCPDHYDHRPHVLAVISTTRPSSDVRQLAERLAKKFKSASSEPSEQRPLPTVRPATAPDGLGASRRGRSRGRGKKGKGRAPG
ncbi:hypothetical protein C8Q77DRAFT_1270422 [Trametes polyzona]|nr:hypothetical protein C8Q77DRAFT_1270422 [Trametes polyzona]